MKRVNYDGQGLVTGDAVAEALGDYAAAVARMDAGTTVEIPVLEPDGSVSIHTLLLTSATSLAVEPYDGPSYPSVVESEDSRFPVPEFRPIGGKAVTVAGEDDDDVRPKL